MSLIRKVAALGTTMVVAAVLLGAFTASANAQASPFSAYGRGLTPGDTVSASIGGQACGEMTADADGEWLLQIEETADCAPTEGAQISFTLNGEDTHVTATYAPGGAPADVANGIDLTQAAGGGAGESDAATPAPADTGNAGLLSSTSVAVALVLTLGLFAAALVVTGRMATRRS